MLYWLVKDYLVPQMPPGHTPPRTFWINIQLNAISIQLNAISGLIFELRGGTAMIFKKLPPAFYLFFIISSHRVEKSGRKQPLSKQIFEVFSAECYTEDPPTWGRIRVSRQHLEPKNGNFCTSVGNLLFLSYLNSSHGFLSMIFIILGNFGST